ncbi:MAG: DUF6624 domain-containing protein [Actinomycetota bacterium]
MERPDLAEELGRLAEHDLAVRARLDELGQLHGGYHPEMRAVHRHNGDRLADIVDEVGCWPGFRLVGERGSEAAFLIAQHDIAAPALMRCWRALYAQAVDEADAEPCRLAYLDDRIRYFEGRPQRYGTQLGWNPDGEFGPWPPVDQPERADERRRTLGLPPLADAVAAAATDRRTDRPAAEVLAEHRRAEEFARQVGWRDHDGQAV